jgi:hypothetical protein
MMARKSKPLLPKRIGKVKLAKSVRKGALGDLLASKAGQALIAEAVLAVGAMAGAKIAKTELKKSRKVQGAVAAAKTKSREAGEATATLAYALGEAVRSFSEALHRSPADRASSEGSNGDDGPGWAPLAPSSEPKAAKPRSPRAAPPDSPLVSPTASPPVSPPVSPLA